MQIAERGLWLSHLQSGDAQRPQIGAIVVRGVGILVAGNDLGGHPVGSTYGAGGEKRTKASLAGRIDGGRWLI